MKPELKILLPDDSDRSFGQLNDDELIDFIKKALGATVQCILVGAQAVRVAEDRGLKHQLDNLKISWMRFLRLVAHEQLLPELVSRYLCKLNVLGYIARLPLSDQKRLAAGEPVLLAEEAIGGGITHRPCSNLLELEPPQLKQIFGGGRIRTPEEQIPQVVLKRAQRQRRPEKIRDAVLDYERRGATFKRGFFPLESLKQIVRTLSNTAS